MHTIPASLQPVENSQIETSGSDNYLFWGFRSQGSPQSLASSWQIESLSEEVVLPSGEATVT